MGMGMGMGMGIDDGTYKTHITGPGSLVIELIEVCGVSDDIVGDV